MSDQPRPIEPVREATEGYELCYECGGKRTCWNCAGSGERYGNRCSFCAGSGYCPICDGSGELKAGAGAQFSKPEDVKPGRTAIVVGRFREFGYDEQPRLVDSAGKRGTDHLAEVAAYLRSGRVLVTSPGLVKDVFDGKTLAGTRSTRTDGVFAWPDALAYFVGRHRVPLPDEFERHMAVQNWRVPDNIDLSGLVPR